MGQLCATCRQNTSSVWNFYVFLKCGLFFVRWLKKKKQKRHVHWKSVFFSFHNWSLHNIKQLNFHSCARVTLWVTCTQNTSLLVYITYIYFVIFAIFLWYIGHAWKVFCLTNVSTDNMQKNTNYYWYLGWPFTMAEPNTLVEPNLLVVQ